MDRRVASRLVLDLDLDLFRLLVSFALLCSALILGGSIPESLLVLVVWINKKTLCQKRCTLSIWARPALTLKEATSGTSEALERPAAWAGTKLVGVAKVMLYDMKGLVWRVVGGEE